ncbi:MAG: metalloregulator ArsR/SmtB family transcription factor [Candidatus Obscuribacterales bacterium]|nr:metalloregulator ArsR/SmtB family transcription factor [Candidatus Obscuribacterales bacterium]
MSSAQLTSMLEFFKVLSDESRLKLVGALASSERTVEELALMLDLKPPTVSHHLSKLKSLDLVVMKSEGNTHLYRLNLEVLRKLSKQMLAVESLSKDDDSINYEAWERKILNDFLEGEKLKEIPASRKKREVILRWLVDKFQFDREYSEKEVNQMISRHHADFATLRRELIGAKLMDRQSGIYHRLRPKQDVDQA